MKKIYAILIIIIFSSSSLMATNLAFQLEEKLNNLNDNDIVSVWIKLPDQINARNFKQEILSQYKTRAEQNRNSLEQLKSKNLPSQTSLLNRLNNLSNKKSIRNIKQHWMINLIEAELTKAELYQLENDPDIEMIYPVPKIISVSPIDIEERTEITSLQSNLTYINAPAVWALGYTGQGRVVCSFDTGVQGDHPALYNNWKGLDGDSAAAWFDPVKQELFPHIISDCGFAPCSYRHGTHVMGIICGHDDVGGDTIGVAPDAKWISAAVIEIAGASVLDAFEWAVNPDGDPNTIDDVPDVINHSWGIESDLFQCENLFYDLIDLSEAMGIVNIVAAGNGGSGVSSMFNPADRALDSIDCFSVGNIDDNLESIVSSSSRGPSLCINGAIKPNVAAPGYNITSSMPGGLYGTMTGTSMAAPHVAGLVALMREKNPNATVDEIKNAILITTNNMSQSVPNNDIGWGRIDCLAAVNAISAVGSTPNLKVASFSHPTVTPGVSFSGDVLLKNIGGNATSVTATVLNNNPAVSITSGSLTFGTINQNDTLRSSNQITLTVDDTVTVGSILSLDLEVSATGYTDTLNLFVLLEPLPSALMLNHTSGNIDFTISNFGTYGFGDISFTPLGGLGLKYVGGPNDVYEAGLMFAKHSLAVSDGVHNNGGEPDGDFRVVPGGDLVFVTPKAGVAQQSYCRFDDSRAETPIGIDVVQNVYSFTDPSYTNSLIMQYIITNTTGSSIPSLYVGLFFDWDISGNWTSNSGGYEAVDDFSWVAERISASLLMNYRGVKVVDGATVTSFTKQGSYAYYPGDGGDGFMESEKWAALTNDFVTADSFKTDNNDLIQIVASNINLASGQTDTVAFAVIAGETYAEIQTAAQNAATAYTGVVTDVTDGADISLVPDNFNLRQNYPNPFNPTTTILFDLPRKSKYNLSIYNLNGQKVAEFGGTANAGTNSVEWDAAGFASGIYLYKLTTDKYEASKKMILLK